MQQRLLEKLVSKDKGQDITYIYIYIYTTSQTTQSLQDESIIYVYVKISVYNINLFDTEHECFRSFSILIKI